MAQLTIRLSIIWPNCTPFWTHRSRSHARGESKRERERWIYEKLTFFTSRLPLRRIWHFLFHPKPDSISRSHSTSCARNRKFLFLPSCARQPPIHSSILYCSRVDNKSHSKHEPAAGRGDCEIGRKITRFAQQPPTTQSVAKNDPLLFFAVE
jgi:hypothetical protein